MGYVRSTYVFLWELWAPVTKFSGTVRHAAGEQDIILKCQNVLNSLGVGRVGIEPERLRFRFLELHHFSS